MDISTCRPEELSSAEVAAWHRLQLSCATLDNAFLSARFAMIVGRSRNDTRVAVVRDGDQPVAFLAFHLRRFGLARALALGISDAQAVVCPPNFAFDPIDLLSSVGIGVWDFDHLVG